MNEFRVKFRGVRGSHPTPKESHLKYGGNTSCVEINVAGHLIILDAGTGIVDIGRDLLKEHILSGNDLKSRKIIDVTLLLSHLHQDHIQGLQFFAPLFIPTSKIHILGLNLPEERLKDSLSKLLFDKVFPVAFEDIPSSLIVDDFNSKQILLLKKDGTKILCETGDFNESLLDEDDVIISAYKTPAHPKNGCLCIKIQYKDKVLIYASDKESYVGADKKFIEFAHNADVLIHDSQYTHQDYISPIMPKQGFGHSTFNMAIEAAKLAKAKRLFFYHYDPNYDDGILDMIDREFNGFKESCVSLEFSKENLEIVV